MVRGLLRCGKLQEIPFLDEERLQELDVFNHFSQEVDASETIVSLFRKQAQKTPDAPAVCFENRCFSYAEADSLSDRIAAAIAAQAGAGRAEAEIQLARATRLPTIKLQAQVRGDIDRGRQRFQCGAEKALAGRVVLDQQQAWRGALSVRIHLLPPCQPCQA